MTFDETKELIIKVAWLHCWAANKPPAVFPQYHQCDYQIILLHLLILVVFLIILVWIVSMHIS